MQFGYDAWANLKSTSVLSGYTSCTATTPYAFGIAVDTNNRVTTSGFSYDLSGNLTSDGINAYTWNAESETKTAAGVTYIYDGDGNRVEKSNGTLYWYGLGGEVLTETNLSGGLKADYVYFDGKRIAKHNGSGNNFYLEDHLGSSRVMTTSAGAVCYDADFLPYGQEVDYTSTCGSNFKFESKERDLETGNDDFGARYYRSALGRWLSPDWSAIPTPVPYANLTNPQTLNLYAMTRDNPESFADLDGHQEDPELVDPKVEEIENKESETLLEKAAGALTSAMQEKQSDDFDRFMAQHPDGWEDPLTGACYAPRSNTPTMNARPGTLGKPDHQQTANEEAAARAGQGKVDREGRIDTPEGSKNYRVGDVVVRGPNGIKEVVQVYRPTPAGNIPKREQDAARDIQRATGVEPKMVPVRPLTPPQPPPPPPPPDTRNPSGSD